MESGGGNRHCKSQSRQRQESGLSVHRSEKKVRAESLRKISNPHIPTLTLGVSVGIRSGCVSVFGVSVGYTCVLCHVGTGRT